MCSQFMGSNYSSFRQIQVFSQDPFSSQTAKSLTSATNKTWVLQLTAESMLWMKKLIWFVWAMDRSLLLTNLTNVHHVESRLVSTEDVAGVKSEGRPFSVAYNAVTQWHTQLTFNKFHLRHVMQVQVKYFYKGKENSLQCVQVGVYCGYFNSH